MNCTVAVWPAVYGVELTSVSTLPKLCPRGGLSKTTGSCSEIAFDVCSGGAGSDAGVPVAVGARYDTSDEYLSIYASSVTVVCERSINTMTSSIFQRRTLTKDCRCSFVPLHAILLTRRNVVCIRVCGTCNDNICTIVDYTL